MPPKPSSETLADASMWPALITQISHLTFIYLDEVTHPVRYLSGSQEVNRWILHSSWLCCIQSDRLISARSKSTPAPPVKASGRLWSRWDPPSNKKRRADFTPCDLRGVKSGRQGHNNQCQNMRYWWKVSEMAGMYTGSCRRSMGVSRAWSWLIHNVLCGVTVMWGSKQRRGLLAVQRLSWCTEKSQDLWRKSSNFYVLRLC